MNDHKPLGLSFALSPLPTMPSSASGNSSSGFLLASSLKLWSVTFLKHPFTRSLESPDYGTGHHTSLSSVASVCWSSDLKDLQQLSLSRRLSPAIFLVILYSSKRYQSCVELCRLAQVATEAALASPWQTRSRWNFTVHHVVIQPTRQSAWLHWVTKVQENVAHISSQ